MDAKEREKLRNACEMCRKEFGTGGEQLILIKLEDVEEFLRLEEIAHKITDAFETIEDLRRILKAEVDDGTDENG